MDERFRYFRGTGVIFRSGLLFRNPVLVGALGLYPIVAAGFGLKNAVTLSLLFLLIAIPSEIVLCVAGLVLPKWARPAAVLLVTAAFYVPAMLALRGMMPDNCGHSRHGGGAHDVQLRALFPRGGIRAGAYSPGGAR